MSPETVVHGVAVRGAQTAAPRGTGWRSVVAAFPPCALQRCPKHAPPCGQVCFSVPNFELLCVYRYLCVDRQGFQVKLKTRRMARGRNKSLISLRDEKLLRRYYYWTEVQRLRFDDALKILSRDEFFLSEDRIMAIIRANCHKLTDIDVRPVPKVRKPRLSASQLSLFTGD